MRARITAPVPGLNGPGVGGIQFTDSIAETDNPSVIAYCQGAGYLVEPLDDEAPVAVPAASDVPAPKVPEAPEAGAPGSTIDLDQLETMSFKELQEFATAHEIDMGKENSKSGAREIIKAAFAERKAADEAAAAEAKAAAEAQA
jgi:hypothetical protein